MKTEDILDIIAASPMVAKPGHHLALAVEPCILPNLWLPSLGDNTFFAGLPIVISKNVIFAEVIEIENG